MTFFLDDPEVYHMITYNIKNLSNFITIKRNQRRERERERDPQTKIYTMIMMAKSTIAMMMMNSMVMTMMNSKTYSKKIQYNLEKYF